MASIGHIAVGMAAARAYQRGQKPRWALLPAMVVWSGLSLLPDADVLGFRFGIKYADPWGHRGATHSIVFALGVASVVALIARAFHLSGVRTAVVATVVVGSHALLDTLTDGGLGCALFWPFDKHRYFAPFNPIPVAPIGRHFFSKQGLAVALRELALFSPVFLYALWPRKRAVTRALLMMLACGVWSGSSPRVCSAQAHASRYQAATACLARGDDACVVRTLAGWARTSEELGLLIETYRKLGQDERARAVMQTYVQRFPDSTRASAYRRMLGADPQPSAAEHAPRPSKRAVPAKSPLEQATECLQKADDACVVRALEGKAHSAQELAILCETYLALGDSDRARAVMREYLANFPDAPRAPAYRRRLEQP